jgi:hypothetical protein
MQEKQTAIKSFFYRIFFPLLHIRNFNGNISFLIDKAIYRCYNVVKVVFANSPQIENLQKEGYGCLST